MELQTPFRNGNISLKLGLIHDKDRTVDYDGGFLLMHELIGLQPVKKRLIAVRPQSIALIRFEDEEDQLCHQVGLTLNNGQRILVYAWRTELLAILKQV